MWSMQNMKKGLLASLCVLLNILFVPLGAQEDVKDVLVQDAIQTETATLMFVDTLSAAQVKQLNENAEIKFVEDFKPNPTKAVIYSAIFPGLGQIYNKKYWKLPIVYGGFMGVVYGVTWNGNMYTDYQNAYKDISINPRGTTSWHNFVGNPEAVIDDPSALERTKSTLKSRRDYFRRNRDLAIIVGVGLYALCMIDAYVDAQLYNFTITPDLSMTVAPVVWGPSQNSSSFAVGVQCNIAF